jgi:hypothetical protein
MIVGSLLSESILGMSSESDSESEKGVNATIA